MVLVQDIYFPTCLLDFEPGKKALQILAMQDSSIQITTKLSNYTMEF